MKNFKFKLQIAHFFKKIYWSGLILFFSVLTKLLINSFYGLTKLFDNWNKKIITKLFYKGKFLKFDVLEPFWVLLGVFKYIFDKFFVFILHCIDKVLKKITTLVDKKNQTEIFPVTEYYKPTGYLQYDLEVKPEAIGKKRHFYYFITDWFFSTNHKNIGTLYLIFSTGAGIIGTVMSLFIRINLTMPGDALFLGNIPKPNLNTKNMHIEKNEEKITNNGWFDLIFWGSTLIGSVFAEIHTYNLITKLEIQLNINLEEKEINDEALNETSLRGRQKQQIGNSEDYVDILGPRGFTPYYYINPNNPYKNLYEKADYYPNPHDPLKNLYKKAGVTHYYPNIPIEPPAEKIKYRNYNVSDNAPDAANRPYHRPLVRITLNPYKGLLGPLNKIQRDYTLKVLNKKNILRV